MTGFHSFRCQSQRVIQATVAETAVHDVEMGVAPLGIVVINGRLSARQFIIKLIAASAATLLAACQSGPWIGKKLDLIIGNMRSRSSMRSAAGGPQVRIKARRTEARQQWVKSPHPDIANPPLANAGLYAMAISFSLSVFLFCRL